MSGVAKRPESAAADRPEKAWLTIRKGVDGMLELGGLCFVACRREIEGVDGGVTLIVREGLDAAGGDAVRGDAADVADAADGQRDLLRFDFFRKRPHFHVPAESQAERLIDPDRHGDGLEWGIEQIATDMQALVREAGFEDVVARIDEAALDAEARPALRGLVAGLAEPTETSRFEVDPKLLETLGLAR